MFPRIMMLDGVSLYRQLRHRPLDISHCGASHPDYKLNSGGRIGRANAGQLCADYTIKAAELAVLFFCQPSGGSAVRDGHITCSTREDGYARRGADIKDLVMYWQGWAPAAGNIPASILDARPFRASLTDDEFPAVSNGSGGGAIHSFYSEAFVNFLKKGEA
jgi:hypothetical protein